MALTDGDKVRYLGSNEKFYSKIATITGVYTSKKYVELTFENNSLKTILDDVEINQIVSLVDKRVAGDYEIINSLTIGDKEVVLGENPYARNNEKYMCAYCTSNDLMARYDEVMVSDNYAEIVELFGTKVSEQAKTEVTRLENLDVPISVITANQCYPNDYKESIDDKVVAIKLSSLRQEYQSADRQLYLVTGGFGAQANARGSAVFCKNLHTGKNTRWERQDVQGEVKPECLPTWAKEKLKDISENTKLKEMER